MTDLAIAPRENFRYTKTEKDEFLVAYLEHGKLSEACRVTGYGYEAAKALSKTEDFQRELQALKTERDRLMEARLVKLVSIGQEQMEDRILHGEQRVTKSGEVVTIKAGLAALTIATGTMFDKLQILRNGGVSNTETTALEKIAESLRKLVPQKEVIEVTTVEYKDIARPSTDRGIFPAVPTEEL